MSIIRLKTILPLFGKRQHIANTKSNINSDWLYKNHVTHVHKLKHFQPMVNQHRKGDA